MTTVSPALPQQSFGSTSPSAGPDPLQVLNALPDPLIVVDRGLIIRFVNFEAQSLFQAGASTLIDRPLAGLIPSDSPIVQMIIQAIDRGASMSEYAAAIETPRIDRKRVTVTVGPMTAPPRGAVDQAVVTFHEISIAQHIDKQLKHRNAARSVTAMAAMLAHEVKNPLSGIRGAAQLLEQTASEPDRQLTRLICDEADRIVQLVNRMEVFSFDAPLERGPVNIHHVLERVRAVAQNGFARELRIVERYDPSLPPVLGNHDQLVQVFLNLAKNAAEAASEDGGEIILSTAYQRGVSIQVPGTAARMNLPISVTVQDNGTGIPEDLNDHLFDPFVSTKGNGTGLGLALVAKIIGDHGGVISFESRPRRTIFRISLPRATGRSAGRRP